MVLSSIPLFLVVGTIDQILCAKMLKAHPSTNLPNHVDMPYHRDLSFAYEPCNVVVSTERELLPLLFQT